MSPRAAPRGSLPHLPVTRGHGPELWIMPTDTFVEHAGAAPGPVIRASSTGQHQSTPRPHGAQITSWTGRARQGVSRMVQQFEVQDVPIRTEIRRGGLEITRLWTNSYPMMWAVPQTEAHVWAHVLGALTGPRTQSTPPVPDDPDPTPVLRAIEEAWDAMQRPVTVDGVAVMPHLPLRAYDHSAYWSGGRVMPARHEDAFSGRMITQHPDDFFSRTHAHPRRELVLESWREGGALWQRVMHRDLDTEVLIHAGVCELTRRTGPHLEASDPTPPRRARARRRILRHAPLTDTTVPWQLLLGAVLGEAGAEAWLTVRHATGENTTAPVLAASLCDLIAAAGHPG